MNIDNGSMNFTASIDTKQLVEAVKDIEKRLGNLEGTVMQAGESLDKLGSGFKTLLGAIGGTAAIKSFVTNMFNVRKSFQDTQSVMEVFLGSTEKAEEHLKALQKYAWFNMFDFETLTQASAQLQAFGTDVDNVIPLIDRLSNIAAGTKTDLMDLVSSFNRAKSIGTADSRLLMSFSTKGLDVVNILKEMGVAVSGTSVSFDQLMMAVESATNEGGRFYNLMDAQFNNLSSLAGAVEDDISIMLNEIGEKLQPTMESALKFTHTLIDNYETIGRVLAVLLTTYGAYRTALIAATVAENLKAIGVKSLTNAEKIHYTWLVITEKAQKLLNKTMLANPYVLLATVVVGATAALIAHTKATAEYRTAEARANSELEQRISLHNELIGESSSYIDTIKSETASVEDLNEAYKKLIQLEPFKNMTLEELRALSKDDIVGRIFDDMQKQISSIIHGKVVEYETAFSTADAFRNGSNGNQITRRNDAISNMQDLEKGSLEQNRKLIDNYVSSIQNLSDEERKIKYDNWISELQKANDELESNDKQIEINGESYSRNALQIKLNTQAIEIYRSELEGLLKSQSQGIQLPIFEDVEKDGVTTKSLKTNIEDAKKHLKTLRDTLLQNGSYDSTTSDKDIETAENNLKSLLSLYKTLTGREYEKEKETTIKYQREAEDARLEIIADSYERQRKQVTTSAQRQIDDINRTLEEETTLTESQRIALSDKIKSIEEKKNKDLEDIENAHVAQIIKTRKWLEDIEYENAKKVLEYEREKTNAKINLMDDGFMKESAKLESEHLSRLEDINRQNKEELDLYVENAKKRYLLENQDKDENDFYAQWTGIPQDEKEKIDNKSIERTNAENQSFIKSNKELLEKLLSDYNDYTTNKLAIDKKYQDEQLYLERQIAAETNEAKKESLHNAMKGSKKSQAKATLELEVANINTKSYDNVEKKINAINDAYNAYIDNLKKAGATDDEITAAKREQVELSGRIATINAKIAGLETEKMLAVDTGDKSKVMELTKEIERLKRQIEDLTGESASVSRTLGTSDWLNAGSQVAGVISSIGAAAGNDALRDFGDALSFVGDIGARIANGDYLGAALAVITEIGNQIADAIAKTNELRLAMEDAGETLRQQRIDALLDGSSSIFGDDAISAINNYTAAMRMAKEAQSDFASSVGEQVKVVNYGWLANLVGKDDVSKSLADFAAETGAELYDTYGNLNSDTLRLFLDTYDDIDDATRQWMENAIEYSGQYAEAMENIVSYLSDMFGNVAGDIADKMIEAFIESGDAAVDLGETVADVGKKMAKDMLKSMILSTYFDGLQDDFKNKIAKDGMNADTAGWMMSKIQEAMSALDGDMEYWNHVIQGLSSMWGDAASDAESVGTGTALASASQESIDLMNGQLNAMRNVQSSIDNKIGSILISLSGIDTHIKDGFEMSNTHLEKIANNTSEQGSLARAFGFYNN